MGILGNLLSDALTKGIGKAAEASASGTAENGEKKELTPEEQEQATKAAEVAVA